MELMRDEVSYQRSWLRKHYNTAFSKYMYFMHASPSPEPVVVFLAQSSSKGYLNDFASDKVCKSQLPTVMRFPYI